MRIVHICLANFYVDGMGYQENLLPKYHSLEHEVYIVTSDYSFDNKGLKIKKTKKNYLNEHGIPVVVLNKSSRFGLYSRFRDFDNVCGTLEDINPDIIFCHGGQFVALFDVIQYCKKNPSVKLFIDQHADYYNSPVTTLRQKIGHKLIYGYWIRKAVPYVTKFWGVTPWRCKYLHDIYGVPEEKIDLLVMGGDDNKIHFEDKENIRKRIREKYKISDSDFLIITGGKIDETKNIHLLIRAIKEIDSKNISLIVFGQPSVEFEKTFFDEIDKSKLIHYIGWVSADEVYDYFLTSDLCVFPGTHSVLWEQACSCGLPGIYKSWEGMYHVNIDGSAMFLYENTTEEIKQKLIEIIKDRNKYEKMKYAAEMNKDVFSYRKIAKRAILGE